MAGSLTVPSGVTLTLSPGTTLEFPSGATLVLNGKLVANGTAGQKVTFTRRSGSATWAGISLTGSGANASSLQHCIISYAKQPVVATNVGSMTISNVIVSYSSFYDNNSSDAAALRFYNSVPTITSLTVNGQSDSWNGVRFAQGSTGSITSSTIQNLGAGNGIVVQGGSSPVVYANTIQNNKYHGIVVTGNGSGNATVVSNSILNNGVVNGVKTYTGINFNNSAGKFGGNTIQGSNYGIYFDTYSSPTTWWTGSWSGFTGMNTISGNLSGIVAYNYSNPIVGRVTSLHGELIYQGTCNNILNNTTYNAYANQNCYVEAFGNWWGVAPPEASKIVWFNNSLISYSYWGTPSQQCPGGGGGATMNPITASGLSVEGSELGSADPISARLLGDYTSAREAYKAVLDDEARSSAEKARALVGLYEILRESKDP
jgi:parallel beta-helix repeat protein